MLHWVSPKPQNQATTTEEETARAHAKLWSKHLRWSCGIAELRQQSHQYSFLLSSEHLSLLKRSDCKAEGFSCLRAVPVEVLSSSDQSPVSLCGSSNTPAKQTGSVRPAFSLLLSFSVDQRECSPAGLSLPLRSLSPQLQTAVVFGWHITGLSLPCEYGCVCWGERQGARYTVTSEECIISSPQNTSLCSFLYCERLRTMQPVWASSVKWSVVRAGVSWLDPRGPMSRYSSDTLAHLAALRMWWAEAKLDKLKGL